MQTRQLLALACAAAAALLSACGSSPAGRDASAGAAPGDVLVYASSQRSPSSIARCLEDRIDDVQESRDGTSTALTIGSSSHPSYFVRLMPSGRSNGAVIRVTHAGPASDPPEPEMRFDIARCTL